MFGSGTACVVSPIESIEFMGDIIQIPTIEQPDPLYKKIKNKLYAIQYGHIEHPWAQIIE